MRKKFSERYGFANVRDSFQIESMDEGLKNRIWNKLREFYLDNICIVENYIHKYSIKDYNFFLQIFDQFFKTTNIPSNSRTFLVNNISDYYFKYKWYEIYDFIEYVAGIYHSQQYSNMFRGAINKVLEEEMSGYRFVDNYIAPIIDNIEIKEIEEALDCKYIPVKQHLSNALELLSDRENPDYQNSIKESITAVESVAKIITGKETDLANCLKVMDIDLNKQFKTAMTNLYGWTCKEDGIRHGHTGEELKTSFEEAKYMLVSCSAFVNYLISKNS